MEDTGNTLSINFLIALLSPCPVHDLVVSACAILAAKTQHRVLIESLNAGQTIGSVHPTSFFWTGSEVTLLKLA
jgi:hypothetical protein